MRRLPLRPLAFACGAAALFSPAARVDAAPDTALLHARALEYGYNLDYPEALATFKEAIARDPNDGTAYRLAAATIWMTLLFQQGAITVDDYLGQTRSNLARTAPPAETAALFRAYLARARALADERVRANPADADAHFHLGAAAGYEASYIGTVEGRVLGAVGAARRAYNAQRRCLELDSSRTDAGLIVGMYRYAVAVLPFHKRIFARLAGFGGSRESGLRLIEKAAFQPSDVQANALFTLILIYNREGRHTDAVRVIRELQRRYPRNRLLWLELGNTEMKAGRPSDALAAIDRGLAVLAADPRPRAFGEAARWQEARTAAVNALRGEAHGKRTRGARR
jgi:tetratricopeptide (TPR) repeat protein